MNRHNNQRQGRDRKLGRFLITTAEAGLVTLISICGCIEPFDPEISRYEDLLVIDGLVTSAEGPYTVRLTRSSSYNSIYASPEEGASVRIIEDSGKEILLEETGPGVYSSTLANFRAEIGRAYHVEIETTEGKNYSSQPSVLKASTEINSLYFEYREEPGDNPAIPGQMVDIFLDTRDPVNQARYYRWDWIETWEFHTPVGSAQYIGRNICWQSDSSSNISIASTQTLYEDLVSRYRIHTVTNETELLKHRYSLLVRQYIMDANTYQYWKEVEKINELGGTLYDVTPSEIRGNLLNPDDPDEPVLGYFQVCGVSEKRIIIDREDLPLDFHAKTRSDCNITMVPADLDIEPYLWQGLFYIDTVVETYNGAPMLVHRFANKPSCYDCTVIGTNQRPDYW